MRYRCYYGGMAVFLLLLCIGVHAQESPASDLSKEFILHPVQEGFCNSLRDNDRDTEVVFKKEPEYKGKSVSRHALQLGDAPADFMGIACDSEANTLYIDLNRNLDLTDDGPGFKSKRGGGFMGFSDYNDITIEMTYGNVVVPYTLDISIYGTFYFSAEVKSGWQGDIEIGDKTCQISISDDLNGAFDGYDVFRIEHDRNREARLDFGAEDELPLPGWILFEGQIYRLETAFRVEDEETVLAVTVIPITENLMEISFEGDSVSRVMLSNNDGEYGLLDWPTPTMRIPQGSYSCYRVDLLDSFSGMPRNGATINANGNTLLKAGGPLNQTVTAKRVGASLSLNYELRGVDDTEYEPDNSYQGNPRFAVYMGDRKVGSGQFEYG